MSNVSSRRLSRVSLVSFASMASLAAISVALPPAPAAAAPPPPPPTAITIEEVSFPGDGVTLTGVLYKPAGYDTSSGFPAVIMMHGCTGMWSNRNPDAVNGDGSPNLQNHIEKWGRKLAIEGVVALAVDSFTPREPTNLPTDPAQRLAARKDWQDQCDGRHGADEPDAYTTRVDDLLAARDYLVADSKISPANMGLLGWSHGAQAAMVESAATPRDSNVARPAEEHLFAASVLFYPGCGKNLGFGDPDTGYWRPYMDVRLELGDADGFHDNCEKRADQAITTYGSGAGSTHEVFFGSYKDAAHSFDGVSQSWPTSQCILASSGGDECAMRKADMESLQFLLNRI